MAGEVPSGTNSRYKCTLGISSSVHLHNWARWMQPVLCRPGWGLLSGRFSQDPGPFLSLLRSRPCPAPGRGVESAKEKWVGQQSAAQQEARAPGKQWPVPVVRNSTRAPESASHCLPRAEGGVLHAGHGGAHGIRFFYDKSPPGLLAGQSLGRIYYFLCLASWGLRGLPSRGSKPLRGKTLQFRSSVPVSATK